MLAGFVPAGFAARVVGWQRQHGRNGLPWQATRDPYRVWLSEVMLQQTQVATALPYYQRFLQRFADVATLAAADVDEVMALWSGLGYYGRARNLHRCAVQVVKQYGGEFPRTAAELETLPGIGRSTAAAIAAFCYGERTAILDANVRRVLARVLAFDGDLAKTAAVARLWEVATNLLPKRSLAQQMPRYTQGLMDLGASICLTRAPRCLQCPLESLCAARQSGTPEQFPVNSRKLVRTAQSLWLLVAQTADGAVWLDRRPATGIWGGLHSPAAFADRAALERVVPAGSRSRMEDAAPFKHVLTHVDLHIHPVYVNLPRSAFRSETGAWVAPHQWPQFGLPAPVRKLLNGLG